MFARQIRKSGAVWMINPDVLPQLVVMTLGDQPIWTAPNSGMADAPLGRLLGLPIIESDVMDTVGDVGDIGLVNWKYQRAIQKAGGIETASSMHLYFVSIHARVVRRARPSPARPVSRSAGSFNPRARRETRATGLSSEELSPVARTSGFPRRPGAINSRPWRKARAPHRLVCCANPPPQTSALDVRARVLKRRSAHRSQWP
jgi:hypothetical protein